MGENAKNGQVNKKSWFKNMSAEFKKIIWPTKQEIAKNTVTVVVVSVILGLIIAGLDFLATMGVGFIGKL